MSFWQAKIRIDAADALFSKFIWQRDGNKCQYCGSVPFDGRGMECSHFWGRGKESTRFSLENCDTFCKRCHAKLETEKAEGRAYWIWKSQQLGPVRFSALMLNAHTYQKKDRRLSLMMIKALMAEMAKSEQKVMGAKS